jgi:hypothetical protein
MIQGNYEKANLYWWKEKKDKVHESVFAKVGDLESNQSFRSSDNVRNMRLYGNFELMGLQQYNFSQNDSSYNQQNRVTLNVIQSMVDTVVSKITKQRPKATFLTDGGDWSLQSKAKKLTKFVEGQFYASKYYEIAALAFQDACIFGTGAIKFYTENDQVCAERVFIDEIIVDDAEAMYGKPRQIHQKRYIHKDVLKEMFPDSIGFIESAGRGEGFYDSSTSDDMIRVIESWHLPSGKDAKDGKHAICIENATLFEEDYTKDYFPFVFIRWGVRPLGFFGQGLSDQLAGLQLEINKILKTIQVSMHLTSIPKVFVEASSKVVTAHLNNKIGGIIKYVGTKPSYESVSAIPQDLFMHLDRLYNRAFEIAGVSQLSAQSSKPSGLDSGRALREFSDIESERFQSVAKRYENTFLEASKIFIDMAKDIYDDGKSIKVKVKGDKFLETIKWKDVDLEEDQYMMHVFPTSSLSSTPSGKLQDVQELIQAGMISPEQGLKLLDFPDLETYMNRQNSGLEDIEKMIELMIDEGEYQTPEPYQDLQNGIKMMQQAYLMYRTRKAPEDRLELFRQWIEDAQELLIRASQPSEEEMAANEQADQAMMDEQAMMEDQALMDEQALMQDQALMDEQMLLQNTPEAAPAATPEALPTSDLLANTEGLL